MYLRNMVCFRYIIVNTLHKDDNRDDDDDNNNNNNNNNNKSGAGNDKGDWNHLTIRQYRSKIPGKHKIKELQKTAILDTAHILREVLM